MEVDQGSKQVFSFHLVDVPLMRAIALLYWPPYRKKTQGLLHFEGFMVMNLGLSVLSLKRYKVGRVGLFAWWQSEAALNDFLQSSQSSALAKGWHVRMRLYRRWGEVSEIREAVVDPELAEAGAPVVAVTLARLKLSQTLRFVRWGRPVERQVRDHPGQTMALAAFRPFGTFSTFSIWKNEGEMVAMVQGRYKDAQSESHRLAMAERTRKDFHTEFSTMRFAPIAEYGKRPV
jgi:hypothetical protein